MYENKPVERNSVVRFVWGIFHYNFGMAMYWSFSLQLRYGNVLVFFITTSVWQCTVYA